MQRRLALLGVVRERGRGGCAARVLYKPVAGDAVPVLCHTHAHTHESGGLTRPCRLGSQAREGASGRWKKQLTLDLLGSSFDDAGRCRHLIARLKTFCPTRSEGQGGTGQSRAGGKSEGGGLWRLPVWTLDQDERVSSGVRGVCMLPDETAVS